MYHDELTQRRFGCRRTDELQMPELPMVVGGGLSLGLAASLNPAISGVLLGIGGLLPLVVASVAMSLDGVVWYFSGSTKSSTPVIDRATPRAPHFVTIPSSSKVGMYRYPVPGRLPQANSEDSRRFFSH